MISFNEHFSYHKIIRATLPSIIMMMFTSFYGMVDGLFLSNFAGKNALAAVNFILPFLLLLGDVGIMFGNGGSALISKTLGEGDSQKANRIFTSLMKTSLITGISLSVLGFLFIRPIAVFLGAEGQLLEDSLLYSRVYLLGVPACMFQYEFQNLSMAANKPKLSLYSTIAAGLTNIFLDALFVGCFSWGIVGAAAATVFSQCISGFVPLLYFCRKNNSLLHVVKSPFEGRAMIKVCSNGFSELLSSISTSIVSMIYNAQLLSYAGNDGLAAYGVLMYINFLFVSIFIGYSIAIGPIISYHYGAKNPAEIKSLLKKSCVIVGIFSLAMFAISEGIAYPASKLFVGYDEDLFRLTLKAFMIFSFAFLFSGYAIFTSAFFTALNNGLISAILSCMRTIVFQIGTVLIFPIFWDVEGIWLATVVTEALAAGLGLWFVKKKRKTYHY